MRLLYHRRKTRKIPDEVHEITERNLGGCQRRLLVDASLGRRLPNVTGAQPRPLTPVRVPVGAVSLPIAAGAARWFSTFTILQLVGDMLVVR